MIKINPNLATTSATRNSEVSTNRGKSYLLNEPIQDSVSFGDKEEQPPKNTLAWVLGLTAVAAGIVIAVKSHKKPNVNEIEKTITKEGEAAKKSSRSYSSGGGRKKTEQTPPSEIEQLIGETKQKKNQEMEDAWQEMHPSQSQPNQKNSIDKLYKEAQESAESKKAQEIEDAWTNYDQNEISQNSIAEMKQQTSATKGGKKASSRLEPDGQYTIPFAKKHQPSGIKKTVEQEIVEMPIKTVPKEQLKIQFLEKPADLHIEAPKKVTKTPKPDTKAEKTKEASRYINTAPNSLVPLDKIKTSMGQSFIQDCQDGYQLWHFASRDFLEAFINAHDDLSALAKKTDFKKYIPYGLKTIKEKANKGNQGILDFAKAIQEKTGINLLGEIKNYRFIGQSELDAIRAKQPIKSPGGTYVTLSANGGSHYNVPPNIDYRVTFKNTKNITDNLDGYHNESYKSCINVPYTNSDVEKVEKLIDKKWQEVEF